VQNFQILLISAVRNCKQCLYQMLRLLPRPLVGLGPWTHWWSSVRETWAVAPTIRIPGAAAVIRYYMYITSLASVCSSKDYLQLFYGRSEQLLLVNFLVIM